MYMYLYVDIMHIIINSYLDYQYIDQHLSGIKIADTRVHNIRVHHNCGCG